MRDEIDRVVGYATSTGAQRAVPHNSDTTGGRQTKQNAKALQAFRSRVGRERRHTQAATSACLQSIIIIIAIVNASAKNTNAQARLYTPARDPALVRPCHVSPVEPNLLVASTSAPDLTSSFTTRSAEWTVAPAHAAA